MGRFVVASTGRSGTHRIAEIFSRLGIPCGHEDIFTQAWTLGYVHQGEKFTVPNWRGTLLGDASRYSPPVVDRLPGDVKILHQVRHPINTIQSFMVLRWVERFRGSDVSDYWAHHNWIDDRETDTFKLLCQFWTRCHLHIESVVAQFPEKYFRYRIEDLGRNNLPRSVHLLQCLVSFISPSQSDMSKHALSDVLVSVPTNYYHKPYGKPVPPITWNDLPKETQELATRYGY